MECWLLSKHKSFLYWLLILMIIAIVMIRRVHGGCIEEERKALIKIKASFNSYSSLADHLLPTWVDGGGAECCDWERVKCNATTRHITDLSLYNLNGLVEYNYYHDNPGIWPLNVSLFLHFKELRSLNLSWNDLDNGIVNTGLERLSSLKNLEILDLSQNSITNGILPSLGALTSLRILNLSGNYDLGGGYFPSHEFAALENLEILDLTNCGLYGFERPSIFRKLRTLNLAGNRFNESLITSLSALPSLKALDLRGNELSGSFPIQEFMPNMPHLEVLLLGYNQFNGTLPMEALASFHHLVVLDLSWNNFVGIIPSAIKALSLLRVVSFAGNQLNGSLPTDGFCELKNLLELDLSDNMFEGNLPLCFNGLSSLKLFDISSNRFTGILLPSLIANLTSLEYIDFSHNRFEGSLSFSSFSDHTKLEAVKFISDNNKFEVETEEHVGWIPMFQLKALVLSNCNINRRTRSVVPSFLLHQHELQLLDLSHNSLDGRFPNWVIENNTMLGVLNLRNNFFGGGILMPPHGNVNMWRLDVSGNDINGTIPGNIQKFLPYISYLNLSGNALIGALPSSIGDLSGLITLDLSDNEFSGEVPNRLLTNCRELQTLVLSNNRLRGEVLSGNLSLSAIHTLLLDNNNFTGGIVNETSASPYYLRTLDISNNLFSGLLPRWISNLCPDIETLVVRNNSFEGQFPCGTALFSFLDISHNYFSGSIPSCLNLQNMQHLHLDSNRFTGSIPRSFRKLTNVLTLDMGNNYLSGGIPKFLSELSNLRILILRENNFVGSIPTQLCQLSNVSLIDLSDNSLSGSIPRCLQKIIGPIYLAFIQSTTSQILNRHSVYGYGNAIQKKLSRYDMIYMFEKQDGVQFTWKSKSRAYMDGDYMVGFDLSCNKLTGEIPEELGLLTQMFVLNLSHNQLTGSIPVRFSDLAKIESLDLSSNCLSGKIPSQLTKLNYMSSFVVANNNLSGRLPEMEGQFSTFTRESYEGNPLLCGPPLEKKCTTKLPSDTKKWYDINMACFYGSFSSAWAMFLLGFAAVLYTNPYWRRRWLDFIEECLYTFYFFFCDLLHKLSMLLYK